MNAQQIKIEDCKQYAVKAFTYGSDKAFHTSYKQAYHNMQNLIDMFNMHQYDSDIKTFGRYEVSDSVTTWIFNATFELIEERLAYANEGVEVEPVYMAEYSKPGVWSEQPQTFLGNIPWVEAVKIAKGSAFATRLSNSSGFNNQGHYFTPY